MEFWKFEWPTTGATATTIITSSAVTLPMEQDPQVNQVVNESVSGVRQAVELGDTRETFKLIFPALDTDDYEDLWNFISSSATDTWTRNYGTVGQTGGIGYLLRPFKLTNQYSSDSWNVYLAKTPGRQFLTGGRVRVELELVEEVT